MASSSLSKPATAPGTLVISIKGTAGDKFTTGDGSKTYEPMSFIVRSQMIIQNCQLIWFSPAAFAAFCPILYPLGK